VLNIKKSIKYRNYILPILIPFLLVSCSNQKQTIKDNSTLIIDLEIVQNTVYLKNKASISSEKLVLINQFEKVKILLKGKKEIISNQEDFWYKVKLQNKISEWIFGTDLNLKQTGQKTQIFEFVNYNFDDLEHIFFKNIENNTKIDFGQGYNNLCGFNFNFENTEYEEYIGYPKYIGKKFKITYNNLISDKLCAFPESYQGKCIIPTPSIIKIERIE